MADADLRSLERSETQGDIQAAARRLVGRLRTTSVTFDQIIQAATLGDLPSRLVHGKGYCSVCGGTGVFETTTPCCNPEACDEDHAFNEVCMDCGGTGWWWDVCPLRDFCAAILPRLPHILSLRMAIAVARLCLPLWETTHPDDNGPRDVLEQVERFALDPRLGGRRAVALAAQRLTMPRAGTHRPAYDFLGMSWFGEDEFKEWREGKTNRFVEFMASAICMPDWAATYWSCRESVRATMRCEVVPFILRIGDPLAERCRGRVDISSQRRTGTLCQVFGCNRKPTMSFVVSPVESIYRCHEHHEGHTCYEC